jgi:hypothetical protein
MGIQVSGLAAAERADLAAARRTLTKSAGQALTAGALRPDDIIRVRFALKRGRSSRASAHSLKAAARACQALAAEFDGRPRRTAAQHRLH